MGCEECEAILFQSKKMFFIHGVVFNLGLVSIAVFIFVLYNSIEILFYNRRCKIESLVPTPVCTPEFLPACSSRQNSPSKCEHFNQEGGTLSPVLHVTYSVNISPVTTRLNLY